MQILLRGQNKIWELPRLILNMGTRISVSDKVAFFGLGRSVLNDTEM